MQSGSDIPSDEEEDDEEDDVPPHSYQHQYQYQQYQYQHPPQQKPSSLLRRRKHRRGREAARLAAHMRSRSTSAPIDDSSSDGDDDDEDDDDDEADEEAEVAGDLVASWRRQRQGQGLAPPARPRAALAPRGMHAFGGPEFATGEEETTLVQDDDEEDDEDEDEDEEDEDGGDEVVRGFGYPRLQEHAPRGYQVPARAAPATTSTTAPTARPQGQGQGQGQGAGPLVDPKELIRIALALVLADRRSEPVPAASPSQVTPLPPWSFHLYALLLCLSSPSCSQCACLCVGVVCRRGRRPSRPTSSSPVRYDTPSRPTAHCPSPRPTHPPAAPRRRSVVRGGALHRLPHGPHRHRLRGRRQVRPSPI